MTPVDHLRARAAVIEIVERGAAVDQNNPHRVLIPNEVRVNGIPLLVAENGIKIHEMTVPADDLVTVTLTLLVRRVTIAAEEDL